MSGVPCSYVILHLVAHPHVGHGVPVGVVVHSRPAEFLGFRAITDPTRLRRIGPTADVELLSRYLASCEAIVAGDPEAGELGLMSQPERFHWLAAPRSDVLQPSRVQYVTATEPQRLLDEIFRTQVDSVVPD